jgi:hypothetical protein
MHQELDICFPNVFRTRRMFLECFPNTHTGHIRKVDENYFEHANTFLELPNAVPYASIRNRTASMLLEYTECFPNTVRSLPEHQNSYSESIRLVLGAFGMKMWRCWVPYPFRFFSCMPPNV